MGNPILKGIPASPGIVVGPAHLLRWEVPEVPATVIGDDEVPRELERLGIALARAVERLRIIRERAVRTAGAAEAMIFEVQISIIEDAERRGELRPGGTIVEGTSGNTGVGLAIAAALRGYRCVFTMPDKMSMEKVRLLKAYGAEVVVTPTAVPPDHPEHYVMKAKQIVKETPGAVLANQFYNPINPEAHYATTGPEIWEQTEGKVTHLVAGAGTGGTVSGAGKYLKEKNPKVRVIAADHRERATALVPAGVVLVPDQDLGRGNGEVQGQRRGEGLTVRQAPDPIRAEELRHEEASSISAC